MVHGKYYFHRPEQKKHFYESYYGLKSASSVQVTQLNRGSTFQPILWVGTVQPSRLICSTYQSRFLSSMLRVSVIHRLPHSKTSFIVHYTASISVERLVMEKYLELRSSSNLHRLLWPRVVSCCFPVQPRRIRTYPPKYHTTERPWTDHQVCMNTSYANDDFVLY